jgi:uncharacterized protein YdaU (DUF1376 family)
MPPTPPAFQTYPKDLAVRTAGFTNQELGAYVRLEGLCWLLGSLPAAVAELARLAQEPPRRFATLWPRLAPLFTERAGRLTLDHLEQQRAEHAAYSASQAGNANKRWEKARKAKAQLTLVPKSSAALPRDLPSHEPSHMPSQSHGNALHTPYSVLHSPPSGERGGSGGEPADAGGGEPPRSARVAALCEQLGLAYQPAYADVDLVVWADLLARQEAGRLEAGEAIATLEKNLAMQREGAGVRDVRAAGERASPALGDLARPPPDDG